MKELELKMRREELMEKTRVEEMKNERERDRIALQQHQFEQQQQLTLTMMQQQQQQNVQMLAAVLELFQK